AILAKGGLMPVLRALARRSTVPVHLDVRVPERLPERIEVATYYVVSEALTNATKHAKASVVHVIVELVDGVLRVLVRDDGVGGVDPTRGSGLVGLKDRVEATGGRLTVQSRPGDGTRLVVKLPVDPGEQSSSRQCPASTSAVRFESAGVVRPLIRRREGLDAVVL